MNTKRSAYALFTVIALSTGAAFAADPGSEASRQDRMDQALQNYRGSPQSQASSEGPAARTEDAIKRGYHKTTAAVKRGAHKVEHAAKKGAHKVENAGHDGQPSTGN
jgi:hypothetical protein